MAILLDSLNDPGLAEAVEFVFRDYETLRRRAMKPGAKAPSLAKVIKAVTQKFNGFGTASSGFSEDDLARAYIADKLDTLKKYADTPAARTMWATSYGLTTLPKPWDTVVAQIISTGSAPSEVVAAKPR